MDLVEGSSVGLDIQARSVAGQAVEPVTAAEVIAEGCMAARSSVFPYIDPISAPIATVMITAIRTIQIQP